MSDLTKNTNTGIHNGHWTTTVSQSGTYELSTGGKYVDRDIDIVIPKASETVSATASVDVTDTIDVSVGPKSNGAYRLVGSNTIEKSITGTATATVNTKGFTDNTSYTGNITGTTSGTISVSGDNSTIPVAAPTVTGSATVKPKTATKNSNSNVSTGTIVTSKPSSGYYLAVDSATASSTSITQTKGGTIGYLGDITNELTASGTVTGGTTTTYIPITSATPGNTANAGALVITPTNSTQNISISEGYTGGLYWKVSPVSKSAGITAVGGTKTPKASATEPDNTYNLSSTAISSGGWLQLDEGYYEATKISLATLIGDDIAEITNTTASSSMLSGFRAYDMDGNVLLGNITDNSSTFTGGTITTQDGTITVPAGYLSDSVTVKATLPTQTLPTSANTTAGSETNQATISRSTSTQYIHIPTGYNGTAAKYTISATPNVGTATTVPTAVTTEVSVGTTASSGYYNVTNTVGAKVTYASAGWVATTGSTGSASVQVGKIKQSTSSATIGGTLAAGSTLTIGAGYYPTARTYSVPTASGSVGTTDVTTALTASAITSGYSSTNALKDSATGLTAYMTLFADASGETGKVLSSITDKTQYMEVYTGTFSVV